MVALRSRDTLYHLSRISLNCLSSWLMMLRPYLHYRKSFSVSYNNSAPKDISEKFVKTSLIHSYDNTRAALL